MGCSILRWQSQQNQDGNIMEKMTFIHLKSRLKSCFETSTGLRLTHTSHHGHSVCSDIKRTGCQISLVFDVGANVGQSAIKFKEAFPDTRLYCFEPVKRTFDVLKKNTAVFSDIFCHNFALSSSYGEATIYVTSQSTTSSLIKPTDFLRSEVVDIQTINRFVLENHIERIDLLKIDTEGFDLNVLKGAENMLSTGQISFVLIEVGFQPGDTSHVLLEDISSYLFAKGFALFGIYEQRLEWSGEKRLRFANVCYSKESAFAFD